MACLDMYNKSGQNPNFGAPMSPRISFSNDFVESARQASNPGHELARLKEASSSSSSSSDFEFSVTGYSMMSADELFFKGRLLPFQDNCHPGKKGAATTTLREELLAEEEEDEGFTAAARPPKGSTATRLKGLLGLRKSHIGSKRVVEAKLNVPTPDSAHRIPTSEEVLDKEGSSCRDEDMEM